MCVWLNRLENLLDKCDDLGSVLCVEMENEHESGPKFFKKMSWNGPNFELKNGPRMYQNRQAMLCESHETTSNFGP